MRNHNSQSIGFYAETLVCIHLDLVSAILPQNEIDRDARKIRIRSSSEGTNFLTQVLPRLGKSIDRSLATGTKLNLTGSGFCKKAGTELPSFMYGVFSKVFRDDGVPWFATWYTDYLQGLRSSVDVDASKGAMQNEDHLVEADLRRRIHNLMGEVDSLNWVDDAVKENIRNEVFPGQCVLRSTITLTQDELDCLNLGIYQVPAQEDREVFLNSRREAMVVALRSLRQVCFSFYKLNLPFSDEQKAKCLADFVSVDEGLHFSVEDLDNSAKAVLTIARRLVRHVLCNADPMSGIPRHGPGAVATGEKLPEKHEFKRDYAKLTAVFPLDEWFYCNASHVCDSLQELQSMVSLESGTAKVVLVPKDSRGPRLISCEPLEYQWVQQSLMRVLVDTIENHPLTKGSVNFTDQEVNRRLALKGSTCPFGYVTLDMKEASDRVSRDLVKALFPERWWECLDASRTPATLLPDGRIVQMRKFAPMGSAVCFPVEALVFWALSAAAIVVELDVPLRKAGANVKVYGDDIICGVNYHHAIKQYLPKFGLMLNESKCCEAGPFKESCGMDAFYGSPVTPTKIRSLWCGGAFPSPAIPKPSMIASYVEYSNAFYRSGMFATAYMLEDRLQHVLRKCGQRPIPTVSGEDPSCIAFVRPHENPILKNRRLGCRIRVTRGGNPESPDYQVHEVEGYRLESKPQMVKTYGWSFLLRKLTELEIKNRYATEVVIGANSLPTGEYPIAHRVRLKRAWTPLR